MNSKPSPVKAQPKVACPTARSDSQSPDLRRDPQIDDYNLVKGVNPGAVKCQEGNELTARLLSGQRLSFEELLAEGKTGLQETINELAGICAEESGNGQKSAESWAAEFLKLPKDDPEVYFSQACRHPYTEEGDAFDAIVHAAAAYAWILREEDPLYAAPGSLRASLRQLASENYHALMQNSARFQAHSYSIEMVPLDAGSLQTSLEEALPLLHR